jgi:hypothetical protein
VYGEDANTFRPNRWIARCSEAGGKIGAFWAGTGDGDDGNGGDDDDDDLEGDRGSGGFGFKFKAPAVQGELLSPTAVHVSFKLYSHQWFR